MICISLGLNTQICKFKIQFLPLYFQVKYLLESQQLGMAVGVFSFKYGTADVIKRVTNALCI